MPTGIYERPPVVADRLRWLAPHADNFKTWLDQSGYSAATIVEIVRLLSRWAEWARAAGFKLDTIEAGFAASTAVFRGGKSQRAPQGAAALFVDYLRGEVWPTEPSAPFEASPALANFRTWMREQRGVATSTLDTYQTTLIHLLMSLGDDPAAIPQSRSAPSCWSAPDRKGAVARRASRSRPALICGI
jgi:integrase/recombinase XerD